VDELIAEVVFGMLSAGAALCPSIGVTATNAATHATTLNLNENDLYMNNAPGLRKQKSYSKYRPCMISPPVLTLDYATPKPFVPPFPSQILGKPRLTPVLSFRA
jgi:hypothetical protein